MLLLPDGRNVFCLPLEDHTAAILGVPTNPNYHGHPSHKRLLSFQQLQSVSAPAWKQCLDGDIQLRGVNSRQYCMLRLMPSSVPVVSGSAWGLRADSGNGAPLAKVTFVDLPIIIIPCSGWEGMTRATVQQPTTPSSRTADNEPFSATLDPRRTRRAICRKATDGCLALFVGFVGRAACNATLAASGI